MDGWMDQTLETLHDNGDCDGVDVTSWVSVCPRGLWKVQQKRTGEGSQQTVSSSGDDACMTLFYYFLSQYNPSRSRINK